MKKLKFIGVCSIACMLLFASCGSDVQGNVDWIPSGELPIQSSVAEEEVPVSSESVSEDMQEGVNEVFDVEIHSLEDLGNAVLAEDLEEFADLIWDNQRASGLYAPMLNEQNGKNVLTYYISSSEGDDSNDGLSPERPKKSLTALSGVANIHIYLKTDDVFNMDSAFVVGENVLLATYGNGDRPKLDFYQAIEGTWSRVDGYAGVWQLDLKEEPDIFKDTNSVEDCNIGHLLIDGECNWKRKEKAQGDVFNYVKYLADTKDGCWAVDWEQGLLYLYDSGNPNNREIAYAYPGFALSIGNVKNVCISGLEITGVGLHGIALSNVKDVQVSNCYLHHIGGAILKKTNARYGNAIELWDSGENLKVQYNVSEWIYDTCYTAQGSAASAVQKDLSFCNNIGSHCFQGLEIWGDGYAEVPFENIQYNENILLNACDVTAPAISFYANENGQLMIAEEYKGYRSGSYPYHQMALLNTGTNVDKNSLQIYGNVFWGTERFLALFLTSAEDNGYPDMQKNLFLEDAYIGGECTYRYSDPEGTIYYLPNLPNEVQDNQFVFEISADLINPEAEKYLRELINKMTNENE